MPGIPGGPHRRRASEDPQETLNMTHGDTDNGHKHTLLNTNSRNTDHLTAHTDSRHAHNKGRVFLWHKNTEMTPFDERVMSAAYIDELKVITTGKEGRCFTEEKWSPPKL